MATKHTPNHARLDRVVAEARRNADERAKSYRERALAIYPWVCTRCGRTFDRSNVQQLTVHHKDHDHHNNPPDGSNWELLCLYCHDNEHQREMEHDARAEGEEGASTESPATHRPFADLASLLKRKP